MSIVETALELMKKVSGDDADMLSLAVSSYQTAKTEATAKPVQQNVRAATRALKTLEDLVKELNSTVFKDSFSKVNDVHKYLIGEGYAITLRTIYNHIEKNYLKADGGVYKRSDVDEYAEEHLGDNSSMSLQKLKAEVHQRKLRSALMEQQLKEREGKLINREVVGQEFAARIEEFRRGFEEIEATLPVVLAGMEPEEIRDTLKRKFDHMLLGYSRKLEALS